MQGLGRPDDAGLLQSFCTTEIVDAFRWPADHASQPGAGTVARYRMAADTLGEEDIAALLRMAFCLHTCARRPAQNSGGHKARVHDNLLDLLNLIPVPLNGRQSCPGFPRC